MKDIQYCSVNALEKYEKERKNFFPTLKEPNIVVGGNPAKKIATYDSLIEKYRDKAVNFRGLSKEDREKIFNDENILVKR